VIPHLFGTAIYRETNPIVASYVFLAEVPLRRIYRDSNFLVISDSTKADLVRRRIPAERITVAECGVDHDFYRPATLPEKYDRPTIVYLGRVKRYKSVQHLISALPPVLERVPEAQLIIVGTGDYLPRLIAQARKLRVEGAVKFTGYVSHEEKREHLRRSHVSVYPSPKEGWGITNIESNACGTPAIAANSPGLRDSVSPGKSGLLYPYGDIKQLAGAIVKVLTDRDLAARLSAGAIEWAAKFTWDDCARRSFTAVEDTLARRLTT
jgi:glycosyltransferase involved in cell wall biosynthesis